jgi:glycosyltransferase involved in cell wall biosynthesis
MARAAAVAGSVGRKLHIPTIANLHNYVNLKYYRKIDHFIPGTEDQRRYLERGGVKTECISLVPHFTRMPGVDEPNLVESSPPIFASFGRFVEIKGFHVLLRSIRILHDRGVQAKLLLGGDGPERTNLERLAKDLAIDDFVKFTGWVDSVPQFLSQSPYFVLPSLSEAFGIATLEAMAQGKAIIAAAAKGPPEGLASALQEAIDNFDHARQKARNALELYKSTYAPPKVVPLFENVYEKLKKSDRGT